MNKTFRVSVAVTAFAAFEIECETELQARKAALEAGPNELEIERHTIQATDVESVTTFPEEAA